MMSFKQYLREAAWHQLPNYEIHDNPSGHEVKKIVSADPHKEARFVVHPNTKKAHVAGGSDSLHSDMMNRSGFNKPQKDHAVRGYISGPGPKYYGVNKKGYSFSTVNDDEIPEAPPGPLKPHPFYHSLRKAGIKDENPHRRDES